MNRRLLTAIAAMLMMLLPVSVFAQNTAYVSTYEELSAAISNLSVDNIVVTANIDVPCATSVTSTSNQDLSGSSTAQLVIGHSLTLQSQAGYKYTIKRIAANGATTDQLKSLISIRGNGQGTSGTANLAQNTVEVTFTNIIIDGGANWGSSTVCARRTAATTAYGNAGRAMIDVFMGGTLNLEDGVVLQNGFTTYSINSVVNNSGSYNYGGAVRVEYHANYGGGTVNLKAGATIHDCSTQGGNEAGFGGALGAYNFARLNVYGGIIYNCSSGNGGAIGCTWRSGSEHNTSGTINLFGGTIYNCCANKGGAILTQGTVEDYLLGGSISNCTATTEGGALAIPEAQTTVHIVAHSSGWLTFSNCSPNVAGTASTYYYPFVSKHADATISETPVYQVTFQNNNTNFAVLNVLQNNSLGEAFPAAPVNANFRFVGWYNGNTPVTSSTSITDNITVTAKWDFLGSGTSGEPYLIPSTEVWNFLADQVAAGNTYSGKYFRQTADIGTAQEPVTQMVGIYSSTESENRTFRGTYDGLGHTLTFSYGAAEAYGNKDHVAPFRNVRGEDAQTPARIQNLHVTGHIYTSTKYAAGIIAQTGGSVNMENCRSGMVIHSSVGGDGSHGGLVGGITSTLSITGCVFDGKLLYTGTTATNSCGGFVGWNGGSLSITNSLYAPATIDTQHGENEVNASYSATFSRNGATFTNCYYTRALGTTQGERAYSVTGGTGVTVAAAGTPTATYNVSGLDFYGANGFTFDGVIYGCQGDVISMNLSGGLNYTATTGTFSGTANPYSLTLSNANSVINFVPVASVTVGENTTNYPTFASAVSAWVNNSTLTLLANVETNSTITINNTRTLDLNGYGIKRTGTGRVILLNGSGNLTINDSKPSAEHRFTVTNAYGDAGLGVVNDDLTSGYQTFHGGYITGGNGVDHGAGIENDATNGVVTINGGVFIGNRSTTHGGFYWGHTNKTLNMNGGRIIYNMTACQGAAIFIGNATMRLYGGEISHNRSTGDGRAHSGGICSAGNNNFYMHGAPIVTANIGGNSATNQPNDICLESKIRIDGGMTNATPIGIMMNLGGYDGTTRGQFSYDSEFIDNSTPSHFVGQNYGDDEPVRIGNALWMWNSNLDPQSTVSTLPTAITGLVYSGAAQALVNAGTAMGGTMKYSLDNSTWSESIPTATDAGSYTVYYKVVGDANHTDFIPSPNTVVVSIAKDPLKRVIKMSDNSYVTIAPGNIQYRANTGTWRFAEHQYDYVGDATLGNVYEGGVKCDNASISGSYTGWIDLFGWGTGNNPTQTSTNANDYTTFTDWGTANAGQLGAGWHTMSQPEWAYIYQSRSNATAKRSRATVGTTLGYIFLPDNWTLPDGLTFNQDAGTFASNSYTTEQWALMEAAGAVFFPCGGYRNPSVYRANEWGSYWLSTRANSTYAYNIWINPNNFGTGDIGDPTGGQAVRLLKTIATAPTAVNGLVYTGSPQALINAGSTTVGTMKYSLDNSSWSASIPTVTAAGNYTVYYMVEGDANHEDFIPSPNTVEVTIDYTISYDLNGGSVASANPSHYNITTATFTLNNPTKTDYTFTGWTGTDLDEPTMTVSIANGSTGNRAYTATFAINKYRIDSIPTSWRVAIVDGDTLIPTAYDGSAHPDSGYVMIPVNSEFVIIPNDGQKPLVSKLELIKTSPSGAINGKFTINASGDQVYFSQGNLQATTSDLGANWSWTFAENQWDYIGNAAANNCISGNGTVSTNGTVDLYGWSASASNLGIHNSTDNSTYYGDFVDWGSNATVQAGIGTGWRTLTLSEWTYVFNTRTSGNTVNGTSDARYTHATINTDGTGVNGMILFPDGITVANSEATSWGTINGDSFWGTKCTSAQWTALESKGCVFLPTAGVRQYPSWCPYVGDFGDYWSSSPSTSNVDDAYSVTFHPVGLDLANDDNRFYGCSVRLVRDAE